MTAMRTVYILVVGIAAYQARTFLVETGDEDEKSAVKHKMEDAIKHGGISFEELEADLRSIGIELTETGYQNAEMLDTNGDGKLEEDEIGSDYYTICSGYQSCVVNGDDSTLYIG